MNPYPKKIDPGLAAASEDASATAAHCACTWCVSSFGASCRLPPAPIGRVCLEMVPNYRDNPSEGSGAKEVASFGDCFLLF